MDALLLSAEYRNGLKKIRRESLSSSGEEGFFVSSVSSFTLKSVKIFCLAIHIHSQYKAVKKNIKYIYIYI